VSDLNCVQLVGRLGADLELRFTQSGKGVLNFDLAVNGRASNRGDKAPAYWIPCVVWDKSAETLSEYAGKGSQLAISGRLQSRTWETQEGQKRKIVEVSVDSFQFLSKAPERDRAPERSTDRGWVSHFPPSGPDLSVDEIPF